MTLLFFGSYGNFVSELKLEKILFCKNFQETWINTFS